MFSSSIFYSALLQKAQAIARSFTVEKVKLDFLMPFSQTDHINKKIYLLEQDGCHPIFTPGVTYDGF